MTMSRFSLAMPRGSLRKKQKSVRFANVGISPEDVRDGGDEIDDVAAWDATGRRNRRHFSGGRLQISELLRKLANIPISVSTRLLGATVDEDDLEEGYICSSSRLAPQSKADQLNYATMQQRSLAYGWLF